MGTRYYSASTGGFYDADIHGPRTLLVEDPAWIRPTVPQEIDGELVEIPDLSVDAPMIEIPNLDCRIPEDAVEITAEEHAALIESQTHGKIIAADENGRPVAADHPLPPLADHKARMVAEVDAAADEVYVAIGGPSPGRLAEYQQAKADALAFQAAGYAGTVPPTIACWATAQGWTAQQACDSILATAAQWEGALVAIRTARLTGKANVMATADHDAARAAADTAIASVRRVMGG